MQEIAVTETNAQEDEVQVVAFQLGQEEYAVDIINVQEIIKPHKITRIPRTERYIDGVINLRGNIIPLFNLFTRFQITPMGSANEKRIIVFQLEDLKAAITVDKVSEVLHINKKDIEPTENVYNGIHSNQIDGIAKVDDRILILLDIYKILFNDNIR